MPDSRMRKIYVGFLTKILNFTLDPSSGYYNEDGLISQPYRNNSNHCVRVKDFYSIKDMFPRRRGPNKCPTVNDVFDHLRKTRAQKKDNLKERENG